MSSSYDIYDCQLRNKPKKQDIYGKQDALSACDHCLLVTILCVLLQSQCCFFVDDCLPEQHGVCHRVSSHFCVLVTKQTLQIELIHVFLHFELHRLVHLLSSAVISLSVFGMDKNKIYIWFIFMALVDTSSVCNLLICFDVEWIYFLAWDKMYL